MTLYILLAGQLNEMLAEKVRPYMQKIDGGSLSQPIILPPQDQNQKVLPLFPFTLYYSRQALIYSDYTLQKCLFKKYYYCPKSKKRILLLGYLWIYIVYYFLGVDTFAECSDYIYLSFLTAFNFLLICYGSAHHLWAIGLLWACLLLYYILGIIKVLFSFHLNDPPLLEFGVWTWHVRLIV